MLAAKSTLVDILFKNYAFGHKIIRNVYKKCKFYTIIKNLSIGIGHLVHGKWIHRGLMPVNVRLQHTSVVIERAYALHVRAGGGGARPNKL